MIDVVDLSEIRKMNDLRPAGYWKERIIELCDRIEELEKENVNLRALLLPVAEQQAMPDVIAVRKALGMPDFPPLEEALAEMRAAFGHHFDGVDPIAFVADLRGDEEDRS